MITKVIPWCNKLFQMESAMAQAVTLTETDVGMATCKVVTATLVDEHDQRIQHTPSSQKQGFDFWTTSLGKFRFTLEELPAHLQMIYWLMIVSPPLHSSILSSSLHAVITLTKPVQ